MASKMGPFEPDTLGKGLSLLTDLYELTMAQSYYLCDMTETEGVFHLFFREIPFKGGYAIAAGLEPAIAWIRSFKLSDDEVEYLASLPGNDGKPLFRRDFLDYLKGIFPLKLDVDAVPEGTIVHANEPILRIKGPILQAQIAETPLLCLVNFYTLAATKAARITQAATVNGVMQPVLEFGLRRAQGMDGGLAASRAAYIGGCTGTSNTLAGYRYGIPVAGTHAHSWVQSFANENVEGEASDANSSELTAFREFARTSPNNVVLLVDTYDTIEGVRHAIMVGKEIREQGLRLAGIRLDSGDLAWLSKEARKMLDEAGFPETRIFASNDLDEYLVTSLREQGAQITNWGIGTKMVTCYDQPTIGGVYKLSATRKKGGEWTHCIKLSELKIKISNPGMLQVRRFFHNGEYIGDILYDELLPAPTAWTAIDGEDSTRQKSFPADAESFDLLIPILRGGESCYEFPPLKEVRQHTLDELSKLNETHKRLNFPHIYVVGLEEQLYVLKNKLIKRERDRVRVSKGLEKTKDIAEK